MPLELGRERHRIAYIGRELRLVLGLRLRRALGLMTVLLLMVGIARTQVLL